MSRILIVEDDPLINSFLSKGLKAAGHTVTCLELGQPLLFTIRRDVPDLILLDLGLPDSDGMELLKQIRGQGMAVPVLIVSARDQLEERIQGLDHGANDYIVKPFRFSELLARIRVQLRQTCSQPSPSERFQALLAGPGGLQLDVRGRCVRLERGDVIDLSTKEYSLLELLIKESHRPVSRGEIMEYVWGDHCSISSNIVDVYIGYLRRKIGAGRIITIRGLGYQLIAP
jgi:DNA-binding response OmpR family regulator